MALDYDDLKYSKVDVDYAGGNSYKITLTRMNSETNRVNTSFTAAPIIRITNPCNENTYSYCGMMEDASFEGGDIFGQMAYTTDGVYTYRVDFGSKIGTFTPIIYGELDDKININKFSSGSNLLTSDDYEEGVDTSLTDTDITITGSSASTNGNKAIYSFLLYTAVDGERTIEYSHTNCMTLKMDGEVLYSSPST